MSEYCRIVLGWSAIAIAFLAGVLVVAAPAPFGELGAWAQTPNQGHLALLGAFGGEPAEVAVEGDTAWVGVGRRLVAVDISRPTDPRAVDRTPPLPGLPRDIAVVDGFVFVALEEDGVYVLDGANLHRPDWLVAHIDAPLDGLGTSPIQVVTAGDVLYVSGGKTVTIADIADPAHPIVTARHETAAGRQVRAMTARGDRVYLALSQDPRSRTYGLSIIDVADRHRPASLGRLELADGIGGRGALAALDDVVLMGGSSGLSVVDVSDPRRLRLTDKLLDMSVHVFAPHPDRGALLYALRTPGQGLTAVQLVDFSDPSMPLVLATEWHELTAVELAASPKHLLLTDRSIGLTVVDAATLTRSGSMPNTVVRHVDRDGATGAAIVWGDAPARNRLVTFDPRVPEEAEALAEVPGLGDAVALDVEGAYAYVLSTGAGLRVVDLGGLSDPRIVSESGYFGSPSALAVSGAAACVLDPAQGLTVLDVTEPLSVTVAGLITTTRQAVDVTIGGSTAWVADGTTLVAVDVGASRRPTVLARHQVTVQVPGYPEPQPALLSALAASDGLLFAVSRYGNDLVVFDVTEPTQLSELGHLSGTGYEGVRDIVVDGGRALLVGPRYGGSPDFTFSNLSGGRLTLVDVSDPTAPSQLAVQPVRSWLMGAAMGDGIVWLAGGAGGVTAHGYRPEGAPATRTPAPTASAPPPQRSATPDPHANKVFLPLLVRSPKPPKRPLEISVEGAMGGVANTIAADGDRVYLGEADRVTILDASDPKLPKVLGTTEGLGSDVDHIAVQGTTLYVTCGMFSFYDALPATSTLAIIDVSDASRPKVLRRIDVGRHVSGPVVPSASTPEAALLLYVAVMDFDAETREDWAQLWVYDVSSPVDPQRVNTVPVDGLVVSMARHGSDLFVAAAEYELERIALQVFDLADPGAPTLREGAGDEVEVYCENATIAFAGDTMLIHDCEMARLCDVSDPAAIRPTGWLANPWEMEEEGVSYYEVLSVAAHDELFYVLGSGEYVEGSGESFEWGTVLLSYETRAPGEADGVAWVALPDMQLDEGWMYMPIGGVAAVPGLVHVAGGELGGMATVTHEGRENLVVAGSYQSLGQVGLAAIDGPFAYALGLDGRLTVLDVTSPASPRVVTATHSPIDATDLELAREHLWLTSANAELGAADVSDPARPIALPWFDGPSGVSGRRLAVSGSTALVSGLTSGVAVFDVTDPGDAVLLSRYGTPGQTHDLAVDTDGSGAASTAYVADGADGLVVLDIADRQHPREIGHLETPGDAVRVVHGSAPGWPELAFVAVADPRRTVRGRPPTGSELQIVDVSRPTGPRLLSRFPLATGDVRDLLLLDYDYVLVIGQDGELIAVDIADATAPALVPQTASLGDLRHLHGAGDKLVGAAGSGGLVVLRVER